MTDASAPARSETDLRALIQQITAELAPNQGIAVESGQSLGDTLGYHSLALLELAFTLEDEFGLPPIDEETAHTILLVGDVEDHVVNGLRARGELDGDAS